MTLLASLASCLGMGETKSKPLNYIPKEMKTSFHDFKMKSLDGEWIDFSIYKGRKVLVVNTASECGYTPQYADLQKLHEKYGDKVVILGFPANNFGGQEPGTNEDIKEFCSKNYGVTFQMFEKVSVLGNDACDLYKWLSNKDLNGWNDQAPEWNFNKYLINEKGELEKYFSSKVKPDGSEIVNAIQ